MKRFAALLCILLVLPLISLADFNIEKDGKNYLIFPDFDQLKVRFAPSSQWTIVHRDNLDEHMSLVKARGDSQQEIRTRFQADTLLFEAYYGGYPKDACLRVERFETEKTREIWHFRHLNTSQRKKVLDQVNDAKLVPGYDTYSAKWQGNGGTSYIACQFTTVPPAVHESGKMTIRCFNGRIYVATYAVRERMAGRAKLRSKGENDTIIGGPLDNLLPKATALPKLTSFQLDEAFPIQTDLGEITVKGKITKGGKLHVTLDGKPVSGKVTSGGSFTVTLPLISPGDHTVKFVASHSKYTDRIETYSVNASAQRTPLTLTSQPEVDALAGDHTIAGTTDPGAEIVLRLDERDPVTLTADENGTFSHVFTIKESRQHDLYIAASAPGKDLCTIYTYFITEFETIKDGIKVFEKNLTKHSISTMSKNPNDYIGERVKISVRVKEVNFTEEGLGILCTYNPPKNSKHAKTPLYLTMYGYAQDQLQPNMTVTVYGTVSGQYEAEGDKRLSIMVEYGTYLK